MGVQGQLHFTDLSDEIQTQLINACDSIWAHGVEFCENEKFNMTSSKIDTLLAGSFGTRPGYGRTGGEFDRLSDFDILFVRDHIEMFDNIEHAKRFYQAIKNKAFQESRDLPCGIQIWLIHYSSIKDRSNFVNAETGEQGLKDQITALSLETNQEFKNRQEAENYYRSQGLIE